MNIAEFITLRREHDHVPAVLIRQIQEHSHLVATARSVFLRQINERIRDHQDCERIAETVTNEAWGMF